jgi:cbb3-type cytochrome c oxidase subunit III
LSRAVLASLAVFALAGCGTGGLASESAQVPDGKVLFKRECGQCHELREAGTRGTIGPNLDEAFAGPRREGFEQSTIREVVKEQIAYPAAPMPANLVEGEEADAVAAYVAEVAANPKAKVTLPAGAGGDDPKLLFESNCGSCHAFADAGTDGTIGPNLDQSNVTLQEATRQIENGGGGMPAFKGQLSEKQIRTLAEYVTKQRRGQGGAGSS